jgi:hypothetical protein
MDKIQAINILTKLANQAQANGLIPTIMEAGSVYTALVVLSQDIPQAPAPTEESPEADEMVEKTEE